jgi:hypothetical protein
MKMHNIQPEWLTDELRSQFASVLVSLPGQSHAAQPPPVIEGYAGDLGLPDHAPAVANGILENRGLFECPHCEMLLSVVSLPAVGSCPACSGTLEVSVNASRFWQRAAVWVPWLLTLLLIFIIVWGLILIGNRLGLGSLDVESYDPVCDNRFESWPWSLRANQHCRIPPDSITGIGWDGRGGSHALVDPSFVVITHNTPPESLCFTDAAGRIHSRTVVSQHTLSMDAAGLPWIRLCRLDSPLPPSVRPLPILDLSGQRTLDLPLMMVGRHGRIGTEYPGAVEILYRTSHVSGRISSIGALQVPRKQPTKGDAKLRVGDSGTPLIANCGSDWYLVGVACAIMTNPDSAGAPEMHIHALLSPQLRDMIFAGAKPRAARLKKDDPKLFVAHW